MKATALQRGGYTQQSLDLLSSIENLKMDGFVRAQCLHMRLASILTMFDNHPSLVETYYDMVEDQVSTDKTSDIPHMLHRILQYTALYEHYMRTRKVEKAEESLLKALMVCEQLYGPGSQYDKGGIYYLLSRIELEQRNDLVQAQKYLYLAKKNTERSHLRHKVNITYAELMMALGRL